MLKRARKGPFVGPIQAKTGENACMVPGGGPVQALNLQTSFDLMRGVNLFPGNRFILCMK